LKPWGQNSRSNPEKEGMFCVSARPRRAETHKTCKKVLASGFAASGTGVLPPWIEKSSFLPDPARKRAKASAAGARKDDFSIALPKIINGFPPFIGFGSQHKCGYLFF
jgi:hypothetical protein